MIIRPITARLLLFMLVFSLLATPGLSGAPSALAAHGLNATPAALNETVALGQQTTIPLTIANLTATPVNVLLYEAREQPALAVIETVSGPASAPLPPHTQALDRRLTQELAAPSSTGSFIVYLRDQADLSAAYRLSDWEDRGWYVFRTLRDHAERTQRSIRAQLQARGIDYQPFWIVNAIQVTGNLADAQSLAARADVALVQADLQVATLPEPVLPAAIDIRCSPDAPANPVCWNIRAIGADRVWNDFGVTGAGVVVASLDTGVVFNHPALRDRYRGALGGGVYDHNYNWYDPQGIFAVPTDENGHGTHTTGTMLGAVAGGEQFGVAPGARWIAAQGCEGTFCTNSDLISAAQWLLAPTDLNGGNPRPDLRPMIANNSWAGGGNDSWYAGYTAAWRAAGIFPVFAAGNAGGVCGSIASPADYADVIGVGATDRSGAIAAFSQRGPTADGRMKPDFSAPGAGGIYSTHLSNGYALLNGTSMATPHVAALAALLYSANPELIGDYDATYAIIRDTARRATTTACGGDLPGGGNNVYGWGMIDAYAAVAQARVDVPWLTLAATQLPLGANANDMVNVTLDAAAVTGPGTYTARILLYSDDLTHAPASVQVTMTVPATGGVTVSGTLRDADTGAPLQGEVGIAGGQRVAVDASGVYTLTLAPGNYTLAASALSYLPQQRAISVPTAGAVDFDLALDGPRLALSVDTVTATLDFPDQADRTVTLTNQGTRSLIFDTTIEYAPFGIFRSDEPGGPQFQWVNLPPSAATLALADTTRIDDIPLGFPFPLYGKTYTELSVMSDGMLSFGWPFAYTGLKERCLPASEVYFDLLAPFRADLGPSLGGTVRYGAVNNGATFVISFENIPAAGGPVNVTYSFQTLLHSDGRVVYQYGNLGPLPDRLAIGVQQNQSQVQQVGCGADTPVFSGLAIELRPQSPPSGWLDVTPAQGVIAPGAQLTLTLGYQWKAPATGANLRTRLMISSNDPRALHKHVMVNAVMNPPAHVLWMPVMARE